MEVKGKIKLINDVETYGTFNKRSFVITTDEQYPQTIQLECHQDKTSILDKYKVDDSVKVSINLRGKEWINPEGKAVYFNTIVAWRIEKEESETTPPPAKFEEVGNDLKDSDNLDLPF